MKVPSSINKIMSSLLILVLATFVTTAQQAPKISDFSNTDCITCHEQNISSHAYNASVHQSLKCTACHVKAEENFENKNIDGKKTCNFIFKPMDCSNCHKSNVKEHAGSIHNSTRLPIKCSKCHTDIHTITSIKNNKIASAKLCSRCHEKQLSYFKSTHYQAIVKGNKDAPTCTDCHGLHAISKIDNVAQGRSFHTQACMKCHADEKLMAHNKVTTIAPKTYFESYHGKNIRLGYPEGVAGCADCHGAHDILPEKDPNSKVNSAHLINTCKQCHPNASKGFVKFIAHAEPTNKSKFPALYWVTIFMNGLISDTNHCYTNLSLSL